MREGVRDEVMAVALVAQREEDLGRSSEPGVEAPPV